MLFTASLTKVFILLKSLKNMADVNMPSGFGGLVRFKEEYSSAFSLKPVHVIGFIILIIAFRIALPFIIGA
jgi:hypothetical protein